MPLQGRLSIEHMYQLVAVSRRGFYRSLRQREPAEEETEVRSLIQQIALGHRRRYGYHRRRAACTVGTNVMAVPPADFMLGGAPKAHEVVSVIDPFRSLPKPPKLGAC
jgi:hypothetical protein